MHEVCTVVTVRHKYEHFVRPSVPPPPFLVSAVQLFDMIGKVKCETVSCNTVCIVLNFMVFMSRQVGRVS
jgi:hypothetical protein